MHRTRSTLFAWLLLSSMASASLAHAADAQLTLRFREPGSNTPTACRLQMNGPQGWLFSEPDSTLLSHGGAGLAPFIAAEDSLVLDLTLGDYTIRAVRGPTGIPIEMNLDLSADTALTLWIDSWADPRALGWISADPHTHPQHPPLSGAPEDYPPFTPSQAALMGRAEALELLFLLANDPALPGGPVSPAEPGISLEWGQEFRSGFWGHLVLIGHDTLLTVDGNPWCCGPGLSAWPTLNKIVGGLESALLLMAHPHTMDNPTTATQWPATGYAREMPALALTALLDGIAVGSLSNGPDHWAHTDYLDGLSAGAHWSAVGETDVVFSQYFRGPPGMIRTYAQIPSPAPPGHQGLGAQWIAAVKAGRSFVSSGPLIESFIAGGGMMGGSGSASEGLADINFSARSQPPLVEARLHGISGQRWSAAWPQGRAVVDTSFSIPIDTDEVLVLELLAEGGTWFAPDDTLRAISSPVWIDVGNPWPVPVENARRGADDLRLFWERSVMARGYVDPADSATAANWILGSAQSYEDMADDPPAPFALQWPVYGDTLSATGGGMRWEESFSYDSDITSYRVAVDMDPAFSAPTWFGPTTDRSLVVSGLLASQRYYWRVEATESGEPPIVNDAPNGEFVINENPLGAPLNPGQGSLLQLGPPRFAQGEIQASFSLARGATVEFAWFDARGRRIHSHPRLEFDAGTHHLRWDGRDRSGSAVAAGVYWLLARAEGDRLSRPMVLLRR